MQEREAGGGRETGSSVLCQARLVQHLESSSLCDKGVVTRLSRLLLARL